VRFLLVRRRRVSVPVNLHEDHVVRVIIVLDHIEPQDPRLSQGGSGVDERRSQEVRGAPRPDPDMNVNDQHGQILPHRAAGRASPRAAGRATLRAAGRAPQCARHGPYHGRMAEPRWLSAEEMRAWQAFLAAAALLDRRLDQQLKEDAGLSHPQYEILVRLSAAPGGELRMTDLAGVLYTSKSGLTYQITQLERAGLVRRASCPSDVRGVVAVLTDAGRQRLAHAAPGHVAAVRALLIDVLTEQQLAAMAAGLGEVARRLGAAND